MSVIDALVAVAQSDWVAGARAARDAAAAHPDELLPRALAAFLEGANEGGIYAEPEGFERFIAGGANPALYAATIDALRDVVAMQRPASVVDLGCGDGRVTAGVADASVRSVTLVEPSEALLTTAEAAVTAPDRSVRAERRTAEAFLAGSPPHVTWSLAIATFALHTLTPPARTLVLRELADRATPLAFVEFDVPDFDDGGIEHARYAAERYEHGLAEYHSDDLVTQRFLLPVLVGQFDPNQARLTHEQSAKRWCDDLRTAGYTSVSVTPVFAYWWAPAVLIQASTTSEQTTAKRPTAS